MKLPRLTIANLMALVLLVALDIWVCKALPVVGPGLTSDLSDLLIFGALPMANVLAIGLVPLARARGEHEGRRPALVGFEVGGLCALIVFLACSLILAHPLHEGVGHLLKTIGLVPPGPVFLTAAVILLLLPQLALALLGARLGRTYRFRLSMREPGTGQASAIGLDPYGEWPGAFVPKVRAETGGGPRGDRRGAWGLGHEGGT